MKDSYFDYDTRSVLDTSENFLQSGRVICRVNVPQRFRGNGIGSQLLRQALRDADAENIDLWLDINPYGEMTYDQLEAWYLRYGFVKHENGRYYREPKS